MSNTDGGGGSPSGMTPEEAQSVHKYIVMIAGIYTGIAVLAHLLMWIYRPWFM
ncbi:MAG: light-harvesting protein [Pseudomonadota bacterium]